MSQIVTYHSRGIPTGLQNMSMLWMRYSKYILHCVSNDTICGGVAVVILKLWSVS